MIESFIFIYIKMEFKFDIEGITKQLYDAISNKLLHHQKQLLCVRNDLNYNDIKRVLRDQENMIKLMNHMQLPESLMGVKLNEYKVLLINDLKKARI